MLFRSVDQADAAYCIIINLAQETCQVVMHNASSQDVKELGFEEEQLEQELYSRTATASTMVRTALHTVHQLWSELEFPPDSVCTKSERFTCLIPYDTNPPCIVVSRAVHRRAGGHAGRDLHQSLGLQASECVFPGS